MSSVIGQNMLKCPSTDHESVFWLEAALGTKAQHDLNCWLKGSFWKHSFRIELNNLSSTNRAIKWREIQIILLTCHLTSQREN